MFCVNSGQNERTVFVFGFCYLSPTRTDLPPAHKPAPPPPKKKTIEMKSHLTAGDIQVSVQPISLHERELIYLNVCIFSALHVPLVSGSRLAALADIYIFFFLHQQALHTLGVTRSVVRCTIITDSDRGRRDKIKSSVTVHANHPGCPCSGGTCPDSLLDLLASQNVQSRIYLVRKLC